jgi:hypothetical protein
MRWPLYSSYHGSILYLVSQFIIVSTTLLVHVRAPASSAPGRPIKRLAHPLTLALEIFPRQYRISPAPYDRRASFPLHSTTLLHTDSFRLTISAFDEGNRIF